MFLEKVGGLTQKILTKLEKIFTAQKSPEFDWFAEVSRISFGKSFGEKALLEDAPRAATITALTDCYYAVIGREDYKKCL